MRLGRTSRWNRSNESASGRNRAPIELSTLVIAGTRLGVDPLVREDVEDGAELAAAVHPVELRVTAGLAGQVPELVIL